MVNCNMLNSLNFGQIKLLTRSTPRPAWRSQRKVNHGATLSILISVIHWTRSILTTFRHWQRPRRSNPRSSYCSQRKVVSCITVFISNSADYWNHSIVICLLTLAFGVKLKVAKLVQPLSCEEHACWKLRRNNQNWRSSEGTDRQTDTHTHWKTHKTKNSLPCCTKKTLPLMINTVWE